MADCKCLANCPFFNDKMMNMPAISKVYKDKYCHNDHDNCARYMVFNALGRGSVPGDLFPNQQDRAQYLINKEKDKQL